MVAPIIGSGDSERVGKHDGPDSSSCDHLLFNRFCLWLGLRLALGALLSSFLTLRSSSLALRKYHGIVTRDLVNPSQDTQRKIGVNVQGLQCRCRVLWTSELWRVPYASQTSQTSGFCTVQSGIPTVRWKRSDTYILSRGTYTAYGGQMGGVYSGLLWVTPYIRITSLLRSHELLSVLTSGGIILSPASPHGPPRRRVRIAGADESCFCLNLRVWTLIRDHWSLLRVSCMSVDLTVDWCWVESSVIRGAGSYLAKVRAGPRVIQVYRLDSA